MEKLESGSAIASFSLIHALLLALIKHNVLNKAQVLEIVNTSINTNPFAPGDTDSLGVAEHFLKRMQEKISWL